MDFAYPKQTHNYLNILFGLKFKNYLEDPKTLCKLLNKYDATATWFPTILVIPDKKLSSLLDKGEHEVGCQVIWRESEIQRLETELGREIKFYVIHGTGTLINKIVWRRFHPPSIKSKKVKCVGGNINLDRLCYLYSPSEILKMFKKLNSKTTVVTHPTYINRRSVLSKKGPTSETFSFLLKSGVRFEKIRVEE